MSEAVVRYDQAQIVRRELRTPDELITEGHEQAKALMKVVQQAGLSKDLGGSKPHLEVEAWQTIGRFNGYLTDIVWTKPILENGEKVGYEARAELVRIDDGSHLIGAEASCFFDEEIKKRDGTAIKRWGDDYAVKSMAQTRAQSKLGRMAFAWVAVLAGYSGTPAEEMEGVTRSTPTAPAADRKIVFPFGKHKDMAPTDLPIDELQKEKTFWTKKVAEETNPKFRAHNQKLLDAIDAAITDKSVVDAEMEPPPSEQPPVVDEAEAVNAALREWLDDIAKADSLSKLHAIWKDLNAPMVWSMFSTLQQNTLTLAKDERKKALA